MAYRIIHWVSLLCPCLLLATVHGQVSHVPAENGHSAFLECQLLTATSVTWKMSNGSRGDVELSTCNPFSGICRDTHPLQYWGLITISRGGYTSTLVISTVKTSETQFTCWTDTGSLAANISLQLYARPSTPYCRISWTRSQYSYIELICETYTSYPSFQAILHRKELGSLTVDWDASQCTLYNSTGAKGDYYGNCSWRIPYSSLMEENTFYVEMFASVGNNTLAGSPVRSSDISATISLPKVIIYRRNCPVGTGVIGEYIKIGTVATCQCDLLSTGQVPGSVRWYTDDGELVDTQVSSQKFSILSFSYKASDKIQAYDCRADNPTAEYYHIPYTPKFSNSLPQSLISGLLLVVGVSLALKIV